MASSLQTRLQAACQQKGFGHHVDNSTDSWVERMSQGRTFEELWAEVNPLSDDEGERACLQRRGVLRNGTLDPRFVTTSRDIQTYYSSCSFIQTNSGQETLDSLVSDVSAAVSAQHLVNRDALVNGVWQDLAKRSSDQLVCRMSDISTVLGDPTQMTRLTTQVQSQLLDNGIMTRLRELILAKRTAGQRNHAEVERRYNSDGGCQGVGRILGLDFCTQVTKARTEQDIENYEREIAKIVAQLPYGYEPAVADSLIKMADEGNFDQNAYNAALRTTFDKYKHLNSYYENRIVDVNNDGKPYYCVDDSFKQTASTPSNPNNPDDYGIVGKLLGATTESNFLRNSQRIILECKIGKKYNTAKQSTESTTQAAFVVGGLGAAALTAIPSGGGSFVAFGAAASIGFSAVSLADQLSKAHAACWKDDFVISPGTGREECNPRASFERELNASTKSECIQELGWAALEAIPIPLDVRAAVRASRNVPTASLVNDVRAGTYRNYEVFGEEASEPIVVTATRRRQNRGGRGPDSNGGATSANPAPAPQNTTIQFRDADGNLRLRTVDPRAFANSRLNDADRVAALRRDYPGLTNDQIYGVIRNHNGVDGAGNAITVTDPATGRSFPLSCPVGTCNSVQLRAKLENLTSLGIPQNTAADMIRRGYAGQPNTSFTTASDGIFSARPDNFDLSNLNRRNQVTILPDHPNAASTRVLQELPEGSTGTQVRVRVERTNPDGTKTSEELFGYFRGTDRNGEALYFENSTGITAINPNDPNLVVKSIDLPESRVVDGEMMGPGQVRFDSFRPMYETDPQRAIGRNIGNRVEVVYRLDGEKETIRTTGEVVMHDGKLTLRKRNNYNGNEYIYSRIDQMDVVSANRTFQRAEWNGARENPREISERFEEGTRIDVTYQRVISQFSPGTEARTINGEFLGVVTHNNGPAAAVRVSNGNVEYVPLNAQSAPSINAREGRTEVFNSTGTIAR